MILTYNELNCKNGNCKANMNEYMEAGIIWLYVVMLIDDMLALYNFGMKLWHKWLMSCWYRYVTTMIEILI